MNLQEAIRAALAAHGINQAKAAAQAGVSDAELSRYLNGKLAEQYCPKVERCMAAWLAGLPARIAAEPRIAAAKPVTTQTLAVRQLCVMAASATGLGQLIHTPGAGASSAVLEYMTSQGDSTSRLPVLTGSRLDWEVLRHLRSLYGKRGANAARQSAWEALVDALRDTGRMLILDGAHRLTAGALRILLDLREATGLKLVFVTHERIAALPVCPTARVLAEWNNSEIRALAAHHLTLHPLAEEQRPVLRTVKALLGMPGGLHNLATAGKVLAQAAAPGCVHDDALLRAACEQTLGLTLPALALPKAAQPAVSPTPKPAQAVPMLETVAGASSSHRPASEPAHAGFAISACDRDGE